MALEALVYWWYWTVSEIQTKLMILSCYPAVPQSHFFGLKAAKLLRRESNGMGVALAGNIAQASTTATQENILEWVKKDKRRMLHVVYRVGDLDRTIKYAFQYNLKLSSYIIYHPFF
jgi:hypothetical protein